MYSTSYDQVIVGSRPIIPSQQLSFSYSADVQARLNIHILELKSPSCVILKRSGLLNKVRSPTSSLIIGISVTKSSLPPSKIPTLTFLPHQNFTLTLTILGIAGIKEQARREEKHLTKELRISLQYVIDHDIGFPKDRAKELMKIFAKNNFLPTEADIEENKCLRLAVTEEIDRARCAFLLSANHAMRNRPANNLTRSPFSSPQPASKRLSADSSLGSDLPSKVPVAPPSPRPAPTPKRVGLAREKTAYQGMYAPYGTWEDGTG